VNIDRGTFLLLASSLAIGATGGYVAAERHVFPELDRWRGRAPEPTPEPPRPASVADAAPPVTSAPAPVAAAAPAAPSCDDSGGTVGECPAPGYPTVEGGCGSFASIRCAELKQAMKPKVAAAAVVCLNKLTPQERCDPARVYLCGHLAFMNACPEREDASAGANANANASANANANASASADASAAGPKSVASICQAIVDGCGASPVAPSTTECRQLLSGMTETGRERTRACMKAHCFDRGLVGCEGVTK
jgi:hypothetical protein